MPDRVAILGWVISFLSGSIPFGLLVAKLFHVSDLTRRGSGNIGATNVARVAGVWPGLLTFLLDLLKGAVPLLLLKSGFVHEFVTAHGGTPEYAFSAFDVWGAGLFAVLGHCYSPWLGFRGGKGVATGFGVVLVLAPIAALAGILAFVLAFLETRVGSIASMTGLMAAAAAYLIFRPLGPEVSFGAVMMAVILIRHEANLDALLENRENAFFR